MLTLFYSPYMTSVDNEAGRASGHADVLLSALGRQQAQELGQHYATESLDAVFCSDLQRASVTAEIAFSGRALPLVRDARLRECDFGKLTLCSPLQLEEERHITEPFPNGESMLMVVQRVGAFLRDVLREYNEKTIVVIGRLGMGLSTGVAILRLRRLCMRPGSGGRFPSGAMNCMFTTLSGALLPGRNWRKMKVDCRRIGLCLDHSLCSF